MKIEELFGTLQQSMVQTWRSHLKTNKYSEHIALDEYYNDIVDKVDTLIENWMGSHEKVEDYVNLLDDEEYDAIEYLEELRDIVVEGRELMDSSELESNVDDILGLIDRTLYKLKNLTESKLISISKYLGLKNIINLNEYFFIDEAGNEVFRGIKKITVDVIDYLYNEGIVDYDDHHLVDYVDGKKDPNYEDIINVMINDFSEDLNSQTTNILKKYSQLSKDDQEEVQINILRGISEFVEKSNCRSF